MDSNYPSYGRQLWQYWRWRLLLLSAVCCACFGVIMGIHEIVSTRGASSQEIHRAR